ncbi:MAG: ABC transporter permease [Acidobacteria bacterium]|nr:ABC transporter permease [Acidobacteriota bacterium]
MLDKLTRRLRALLRRPKVEHDLDEELRFHLSKEIEQNAIRGMGAAEARRAALVKFGGVEKFKEECRDARGVRPLEDLWQDLRYGLRRLAQSPGFSLVAVLSLALGIGANTAIFSLVNAALLRPLPVERPGRIVSLANAAGSRGFPAFSYPNYKDFRDRSSEVFDGLYAYRFAPLSVSHDGASERLWGYVVTGNYFEVLGVKASLGRVLTPEDDRLPGAYPVTVMSYEGWRRRFGADPSVVGKTLIVNGRSFTVVGVLPPGFYGTEIIADPELWFPVSMQAEIEVGNNWLDKRAVENLLIQGRLKPGVGADQAQAALNAVALQLEREFPDINEGNRVTLSPPGFISGMIRGAVLGFTGLLMAVVAFVLLLACVNLANLLLARGAERRKEIAMRLALGASRLRIVRQLMAESMLLAAGGGAVGTLLAYWLVRLAAGFKPPVDVPLAIDLRLDYRVMVFTCLVSLLTGVLFGLLPAWQATKVELLPALKDESSSGGFRRSRLKSGLVALQVALSLVLLVGGGLMLRALRRAQALELGFNPQGAVEASFDLRLQGYDEGRGREFQRRLLERVRELPGVHAAGLVDLAPVDLHFSRDSVYVEGRAPERVARTPRAMTSRAGPGYFRAMSTRLVRGRDFTERDDERSLPVAIVNETFARRFWPGEDPLGRRFRLGGPESPLLEVVGVVEDGKYAGLSEEPQGYVVRPLAQAYTGTNTVILRTERDAKELLAAVVGEMRQLDPHLPVSGKPLEERLAMPLLPVRVAATLLGGFGLLALALAAIGIYGVMSYAVSRRTREIGIRMALGAQASNVLRLTIRQGMTPVLAGVGAGLAAALGLTRLARSLLFGVSAADPLTYAGVAALLTTVALLACYVPARRATKVDPLVALRSE